MKLPEIKPSKSISYEIISYDTFKKRFSDLNKWYASSQILMDTLVKYKYVYFNSINASEVMNNSGLDRMIIQDLIGSESMSFFDNKRPIIYKKYKSKNKIDVYIPFK